jgi:hypothetical protein
MGKSGNPQLRELMKDGKSLVVSFVNLGGKRVFRSFSNGLTKAQKNYVSAIANEGPKEELDERMILAVNLANAFNLVDGLVSVMGEMVTPENLDMVRMYAAERLGFTVKEATPPKKAPAKKSVKKEKAEEVGAQEPAEVVES